MSELARFSQQFKLVDPQGNIQFIGAGIVLNPTDIINGDTNKMFAGEVMQMDTTNAVVPRFDRVAAGSAIPADLPQVAALKYLKLVAAGTPLHGVCLQDLAVGQNGVFAGAGSIVTINSKNPPTVNTVNAQLTSTGATTGTTTSSLVEGAAAVGAGAATNLLAGGTRVGYLIKPAGTNAGSSVANTGALGIVGAFILPG